MTTNKQRREAERRRLQRQLEQRRQREIARRRFTLISSVVGTLAVIVVMVVVIIALSGGDNPKPKKAPAAAKPSTSTSTSTSAAAAAPTTSCATNKGAATSFKGVTVAYANNLKHEPKVRSKSSAASATVQCQDLVVGTGKAATTTSRVSVQYTGVLYKNGKQFDSSWAKGGKPVPFSLAQVVPGFTQGIGGAGKVAPMKVGGRRIIIMPAALAYGAQGNQSVPPNSALVFVVDLKSVTG